MDLAFSTIESTILNKIATAATELNMPSYLIGGFVRDKIIGRATKDADIVCLGDGIALAHRVADLFQPRPPVAYFKNFGTAQIKLPEFEIEFVKLKDGIHNFEYIYCTYLESVSPSIKASELAKINS